MTKGTQHFGMWVHVQMQRRRVAVLRNGCAFVNTSRLDDARAESHLSQILQNLIANGLKYCDHRSPRIHIAASRRGSAWSFSVQDNGIGIDLQYKETIFGVFKRLDNDRKYSGTGIALAICQRIVQRYSGRIWVESELGNGATFFFTVPERALAPRPAVQPADR
jgi:light-regulated signal transduction histidine kinase (bacteriophytochrome)